MFKPMSACAVTQEQLPELKYPLYASVKLDGVRAVVRDGVLLTRNLTPVLNKQMQAEFGRPEFEGLDGELVYGTATDPNVFLRTVSLVKRADTLYTQGAVEFFAFDVYLVGLSFKERQQALTRLVKGNVRQVDQSYVYTAKQASDFARKAENAGYEGAMLRHPDAPYKCGRSTLAEHGLLKLKSRDSAAARVVNYAAQLHNVNPLVANPLGRAKRSSAAAGQERTNKLGSLTVRDEVTGLEFNIGSGFTDVQRVEFFAAGSDLIGRRVRYLFQSAGMKSAPRFPVFAGFIEEGDHA